MNRMPSQRTLRRHILFIALLLFVQPSPAGAARDIVGDDTSSDKGGEWTSTEPDGMPGYQADSNPDDFKFGTAEIQFYGWDHAPQIVGGWNWEPQSTLDGTLRHGKGAGTFSGERGDSYPTATPINAGQSTDTPRFWSWAQTPPMGWNSWDCYGPTVTEAEVKSNADYMAEHLKSHGWQYIVVDIRWFVENTKAGGYNQKDPRYVMDEYGRFTPALNRFPSAAEGKGFKPLADCVHGKGLKFGIHLMRGIPVEAVKKNSPILGSEAHAADIYSTQSQCPWLRDTYTIVADRPGAQEYYNSLFDLYASWGVDYVKIDDLSRPYHLPEIELIRKAIDGCGRPIVLSMSPGATPLEDAEHAVRHANLWRISDDFWDRWQDIIEMFDRCRNWVPFTGPGHWPDADMLPLGRISIRGERGPDRRTRLTKDEQITLMTLWSIFRSPLMFGGDLPSNDEFTLSLLTNDEVLAVNQRSTNGRELFNRDGLIAWSADAPNSPDKFVAFFNTRNGAEAVTLAADLGVLGFEGQCTVRDLWAGKILGGCTGQFSASISTHGAGLYLISPK